MIGYNFTNDVRLALENAREQAAALGHARVDPGHLLLGLIQRPGAVCGNLLSQLALEPSQIIQGLRAAMGPPDKGAEGPDLPYTAPAKRVLERAMQEAGALGHNFVGTEHLLLGLIADRTQPVTDAMAAAGVSLEPARAALQAISPAVVLAPGAATARRALLVALIALAVALTALVLALRT